MKARSVVFVAVIAVAGTLGPRALAQDAEKPAKPAQAAAPRKAPRGKDAAKAGTTPAPETPKPAPRGAAAPKPKAGAGGKGAAKPAGGDATGGKGDAGHGAPVTREVVERESHIEFDERVVRGQTAAGAIYLFQRAPSEFKSIVQVPDSFRSRTVELLSPRRAGP